MKTVLITILLCLCPCAMTLASPEAPSQNPSSRNQLMGFQEWKKNQVFDARKSLDEFKSPQLSKMAEAEQAQNIENVENPGDNSQADDVEDPESTQVQNSKEPLSAADSADSTASIDEKAEKLRQLEFNLEIAKGLTIHDYFALYLKNKSKEEMAIAIKKLSPEELSELLIAYRKSLYGLPEQAPSSNTALQ